MKSIKATGAVNSLVVLLTLVTLALVAFSCEQQPSKDIDRYLDATDWENYSLAISSGDSRVTRSGFFWVKEYEFVRDSTKFVNKMLFTPKTEEISWEYNTITGNLDWWWQYRIGQTKMDWASNVMISENVISFRSSGVGTPAISIVRYCDRIEEVWNYNIRNTLPVVKIFKLTEPVYKNDTLIIDITYIGFQSPEAGFDLLIKHPADSDFVDQNRLSRTRDQFKIVRIKRIDGTFEPFDSTLYYRFVSEVADPPFTPWGFLSDTVEFNK